jgi:hypothetical protein
MIRFVLFGNRVAPAAVILLLVASSTFAQAGGIYNLTNGTIASGGATFSTGGSYRVGGSIGQPTAGGMSDGIYMLGGGFWGGGEVVAAPTPTATVTALPTRTATATTMPTASPAAPTPTGPGTNVTNTPSHSPTRSQSPLTTSTVTVTATASPTPTPPLLQCTGDCDQSGGVTVDELIRGVNILLGRALPDICPSFDTNDSGTVTVDELVAAVNRTLNGC